MKSVLDPSLLARLRGVASRLRRFVFVEGIAALVVFLAAGCLAQFVIDYGFQGIRWSMRAALLLGLIAAAAAIAWRFLLRPLRRRISPSDIANLVERRFPDLRSTLISAVRFASGHVGPGDVNSPELMGSVTAHAGHLVAGLNWDGILDARRMRRAGLLLLTVLLLAAGAAIAAPQTVSIWFARNVLLSETPWPKQTHLIVEFDGDELVAARGDDVLIEAHAEGVEPREVEVLYETASAERGREAMTTVGSAGSYRYRYVVKNVQEDFSFRLRGGDDETRTLQVRLVDRPFVEGSRMEIMPPAYAGLENRTLGDGERSVQVLRGSRVVIHARTNKPVTKATLMDGSDTLLNASITETGCSVEFQAMEGATYHFALRDSVGLEDRRPVLFAIRVIKDEPPRAVLRLPGAGDMITPEAVLPIALEFEDKYGLAKVELLYQVLREGSAEEQIALPSLGENIKTFSTTESWAVASAGVLPGDRITLLARASDFDDVSGPNMAQSAEVSLRVVTRDELLADLARREQEYRMAFERLIDAQEQVRGRLLSARSGLQTQRDVASFSAAVGPLERRQRSLAGNVNVIRQQFDQNLSEMRINQLDTQDDVERLKNRILEPLEEVSKRDLTAAADTIRLWSRDATEDLGVEVDRLQVSAVEKMRVILSNMLQWEGYYEVVSMLRDIIRLQNELSDEAKKAVEEQAKGIFDD